MNKKRFNDLKIGEKFKYRNGLRMKDGFSHMVSLSSGLGYWMNCATLVTPVKVKIEIVNS